MFHMCPQGWILTRHEGEDDSGHGNSFLNFILGPQSTVLENSPEEFAGTMPQFLATFGHFSKVGGDPLLGPI